MRLALDVDGVLADVMASWLTYNNRIRKRLSRRDLTDWHFWKGLGIDDFYGELSMCWKDWIAIPPTEQNLSQTVRELSELARIDIVTAREKSTDGFVKEWLDLHRIHFDSYVSVVSGPMKAELDYDVFIDDSPLNASSFLKNNKTVLVYSQPWNRGLSDPGLRRISSLSEAAEILRS